MAGFFLKMIGASDHPLLEGVDVFDAGGAERDLVRFPTRQFPKQWTGDERLIYYAVGGSKKIFAAGQLTGPPVQNPAQRGNRWPHIAPISLDPSTVVRDLRYAPELIKVDLALLEQVGKDVSWIQMTRQQHDDACALLRSARLSAPASARRPL